MAYKDRKEQRDRLDSLGHRDQMVKTDRSDQLVYRVTGDHKVELGRLANQEALDNKEVKVSQDQREILARLERLVSKDLKDRPARKARLALPAKLVALASQDYLDYLEIVVSLVQEDLKEIRVQLD